MVIWYQHPVQNVRAIRRIVIIAKTCMLTLLVAGIFFSAAAAQPEGTTGITWTKTYPDCAYCEAHAITRTSDGGYLVTGTGGNDPDRHGLLLLKTDSAGNEQWRTIDNGNSCEGNAVIALPHGNATVTGGGCNTGTDAATLTVIDDTKGTVRQVWNFDTGMHATGTALLTTADGGYLLLSEGDTRAAGRKDRDLIISRIDAGETILWTKIFSGPRNDTAKAVITAPDGGFVIAGTTMNPVSGRDEIFLLKLDAKGTEQWVRTVGTDDDESAQSIAFAGDGGYIIAGTACHRGRSGDCDIHVIRIDAAGTTLWDRKYGGTGRTSATGVLASTEGGYTLAGYSDSSERGALDRDVHILHIDETGSEQWNSTFGTPSFEIVTGAIITKEGALVLTGYATDPVESRKRTLFITSIGRAGRDPPPELLRSRTLPRKDTGLEVSIRDGKSGPVLPEPRCITMESSQAELR